MTPPPATASEPVSHGRPILLALAALVVLTLTRWGLAHVPLGAAATAVALTISAVKVAVVVTVFMEIAHATTAARVTGAVTVGLIALLCAVIVSDVNLR